MHVKSSHSSTTRLSDTNTPISVSLDRRGCLVGGTSDSRDSGDGDRRHEVGGRVIELEDGTDTGLEASVTEQVAASDVLCFKNIFKISTYSYVLYYLYLSC